MIPSEITAESKEVVGKLLMDAIQVNPEAKPVVMSLIDILMDNHVPQERWGMLLFRVWQELNAETSERREESAWNLNSRSQTSPKAGPT